MMSTQNGSSIEDKRAGLELAVLFKSDAHPFGRDAIVHAFEKTLADYLTQLLDPGLDDGTALHVRAKAIGLIETLSQMGVDIAHAMQAAPVRRSVSDRIHESLGTSR